MLAEIGDITRFANARKLASWAGLTPTVRGSDLTVRHGHISKQGSAWLRWVLNQAAQTAKRSPEFSATYAAIARRRGKKIATIAIARKLLTRAYHLLAAAQAPARRQPAARLAPPPRTRRPGGSPSPGQARSSGISRPPAALDHLTEQPGPRTHGHGARLHWRGAGWVLARPLRLPHAGDSTRPFIKPDTKGSFLASDDPPPLVGVQLVRPRRYAAAGAPAGPLPRGGVTPAAARKIPKNSQAQPGDTTQVTGLKPHALLTLVALMGAARSASAATGRRRQADSRPPLHTGSTIRALLTAVMTLSSGSAVTKPNTRGKAMGPVG